MRYHGSPLHRLRPPIWSGRAILLSAMATAVSCSDSLVSPYSANGVLVQIRVTSVSTPALGSTPDGFSTISCQVGLEAVAGPGNADHWMGAIFRWYPGGNLAKPFDSATVDTRTVQGSWGTDTIGSGQQQESGWVFTATVPFTVEVQYRLSQADGGTQLTPPVLAECSPSLPAHPTLPTIIGLTVAPASGAVHNGDTLSVSFSAAAAAGLWQAAVVLSGACDTAVFLAEDAAATARHTVRLTIPTGCAPGAALKVDVTEIDAALQSSLQAASGGPLTFVDVEPPVVGVSFQGPALYQNSVLTGSFFVGESIGVFLQAYDNNALRSLSWGVQPGNYRDSASVNGTYVSGVSGRLPVSAGWGPTTQLQFYATDRAGLVSPVFATSTDSLLVYPTVTVPTQVVSLIGQASNVVIDSRRGMIYVLYSGEIGVVSLHPLALVRTIQLPDAVSGFDLSPGGDSLIVAYWDGPLGVINLADPQQAVGSISLTSLPTGGLLGPIVALPGGSVLIGVLGGGGLGSLMEKNLLTGDERWRPEALGGAGVEALVRSGDHGLVVLLGLFTTQVFTAASDSFGPPVSGLPSAMPSVDSAGQHIALGTQIFDRSLHETGQAELGWAGTSASALSADGQSLYWPLGARGIVDSRVSDGAVLQRFLPSISPNVLRVSPDGAYLVLIQALSASFSIAVAQLK